MTRERNMGKLTPAVGLSKRDYWRVGGLSKREQQRWAFALE